MSGSCPAVTVWDSNQRQGSVGGETIDVRGQWIWFVLIDRRCPINGQATQDETQEDWQVQPVAAPHQQLVPASYKHASLTFRRACSDVLLIELSGTWHRHSPR
jgi:hypothetical protein